MNARPGSRHDLGCQALAPDVHADERAFFLEVFREAEVGARSSRPTIPIRVPAYCGASVSTSGRRTPGTWYRGGRRSC
jgi:hypothetical protein